MTRVELWGITETARAFGVANETAQRWVERDEYPRPVASLAQGRVWMASEVRQWHKRRVEAKRKARVF